MFHVRNLVRYTIWTEVEFAVDFDPKQEEHLTTEQWIKFDTALQMELEKVREAIRDVPGYVDHEYEETVESEVTKVE
jgi:hypothetical protein